MQVAPPDSTESLVIIIFNTEIVLSSSLKKLPRTTYPEFNNRFMIVKRVTSYYHNITEIHYLIEINIR